MTGTDAENVCIRRELLEEAVDYLWELLGEWHWKKDEPIAGKDKEYYDLRKCTREVCEAMHRNCPEASASQGLLDGTTQRRSKS